MNLNEIVISRYMEGYAASINGEIVYMFKPGYTWMKTSDYADFKINRFSRVDENTRKIIWAKTKEFLDQNTG